MLWCFPITSLLTQIKFRVRTLFWTKTSRTFQGLSRTHFAFFKDSIQCKKEIWVYVFFSSTTTWAILSWRSFILGTWESGLDKVSTEIQGLSSTDYNFQGLSRPWTFYFKFQGLSRTFKVRANPENSSNTTMLNYTNNLKSLKSWSPSKKQTNNDYMETLLTLDQYVLPCIS